MGKNLIKGMKVIKKANGNYINKRYNTKKTDSESGDDRGESVYLRTDQQNSFIQSHNRENIDKILKRED